jgi:hypothetical protein
MQRFHVRSEVGSRGGTGERDRGLGGRDQSLPRPFESLRTTRRPGAALAERLPRQRKMQRDKLAVLAASMLHGRSANLVELAAGPSTSSGAARVRSLGHGLSVDVPVCGQRFGVLRCGHGAVGSRDLARSWPGWLPADPAVILLADRC